MRTSTATRTERTTGRAGLTLLELVATLTVVAMAAGVVWPWLRAAGALGVEGAAPRADAALVVAPDDAPPASIGLVDARGRRARVLLPPGMGPARVETGGGT